MRDLLTEKRDMENDGTLVKDARAAYCSVTSAHKQLGGYPAYVTLLEWAKSGKIPGVWHVGRLVLIPQGWVDEKLQQAQRPTKPARQPEITPNCWRGCQYWCGHNQCLVEPPSFLA